MKSIDTIETYAYRTRKDLVSGIQNNTKIINFDDVTKGKIKKHNLNWPQLLDHPYKTSIGSGSRKANLLF